MSKTIDFNEAQKSKAVPTFETGTYTMTWEENGKARRHKLTGDERIWTECQVCGKEHELHLEEFTSIMGTDGHNIYDTRVNCLECSKGLV